MTEQTQIIIDLINQSTLSNEDKEEFIEITQNFATKNIIALNDSFQKDSNTLTNFWRTLKTKLLLMELVKSSEQMSEAEREYLINQISEMNSEEINVFIDTVSQLNTTKNPQKKVEELLQAHEETHKEFIQTADKALSSLQKIAKKLQKTEDGEDYDEIMAKINSINS